MRTVAVGTLKPIVLPKHQEVFAREIWGPGTGTKKVTVLHNVMLAHGGAEMHVHQDSEHVFYVLKGELQVDDGRTKKVVTKGQALIVEAGEPHQVTGTGSMDCEYLLVTCPPAIFSHD